jgi:enoyl-CoA hydratase/carnithine racemase
MYKSLLVDKNGPVWRVVLNRPEVRNAHDLTMFKELVAAESAKKE